MRFLLSLLLLLPLVGQSQTVMSAWTATNGGILYVSITNMSTNGAWASFGLGKDNARTGKEAVKVMLTVTGNGFSEAGAVQTSKNRTLVGTSTNTLFRFTRRGSYTNDIGIGKGDYRYLSGSPAFRFIGPRVLSHKLDGPTSAIDPPGACIAGNVKKGAVF